MKQPVRGRPIRVQNISRYIPMDSFYRMCARIPAKYEKYRLNYFIIRFMTRRPCESVAINLTDIVYDRQAINMMMGKTNIITEVSVPDWLWARLLKYIELNKHTFRNGFIFPGDTSSHEHIQVDSLSKYFRQLMDEEGMTATVQGRKSHYRLHRFYDLVMSGTTDIVEISDKEQGRICRRHTDDRAINAYCDSGRLSQERKLFNAVANRYRALEAEPVIRMPLSTPDSLSSSQLYPL